MKLAMGALAVLGAVAIGGAPALAFTLSAQDQPDTGTTRVATDEKPGNGPPAHANSSHNRDGADKPGNGPPAHAKSSHNRDGADKPGKIKDKAGSPGALGRAHAEAMKEWATCVGAAAREHDEGTGPFEPETVCGEKPPPPGQLKKQQSR